LFAYAVLRMPQNSKQNHRTSHFHSATTETFDTSATIHHSPTMQQLKRSTLLQLSALTSVLPPIGC
jgi:hypothetical protein